MAGLAAEPSFVHWPSSGCPHAEAERAATACAWRVPCVSAACHGAAVADGWQEVLMAYTNALASFENARQPAFDGQTLAEPRGGHERVPQAEAIPTHDAVDGRSDAPAAADAAPTMTLGSCHQCKRRLLVRRCAHEELVFVQRKGRLDQQYERCRRSFCATCLRRYAAEQPDEPKYRPGIFRCPSCRRMCVCKPCQRQRGAITAPNRKASAGGGAHGSQPPQPAVPATVPVPAPASQGPPPTPAETPLSQTLEAEPSTQLPSASATAADEPAYIPAAALLSLSASHPDAAGAVAAATCPGAPTRSASVTMKCKLTCPGCACVHRVRIQGSRDALEREPQLIAYACRECSWHFHVRIAKQSPTSS